MCFLGLLLQDGLGSTRNPRNPKHMTLFDRLALLDQYIQLKTVCSHDLIGHLALDKDCCPLAPAPSSFGTPFLFQLSLLSRPFSHRQHRSGHARSMLAPSFLAHLLAIAYPLLTFPFLLQPTVCPSIFFTLYQYSLSVVPNVVSSFPFLVMLFLQLPLLICTLVLQCSVCYTCLKTMLENDALAIYLFNCQLSGSLLLPLPFLPRLLPSSFPLPSSNTIIIIIMSTSKHVYACYMPSAY